MTATSLPDHGTLVVRAADWEDGERPGERIRRFIDDPSGHRAMVMTVAPGPLGALHAHDQIEQIYVVDGDFFDDAGQYGAGDFVLRMPGTLHRAGSRNGCTMLIVYTPVEPRA